MKERNAYTALDLPRSSSAAVRSVWRRTDAPILIPHTGNETEGADPEPR